MFSHIKMGIKYKKNLKRTFKKKDFLTFGDFETEKNKFYHRSMLRTC